MTAPMQISAGERTKPGIYHNMPWAEYCEIPALSHSAMKDLAVSPYRYWYLHVNPERPVARETPEMQFGTAVHCAVLEPGEFENRFCREIDPSEYPNLLTTIEDLRQFLRDKGVTPKGTRKAELVDQAQRVDSTVPILDVLRGHHEAQNEGKIELSVYDWRRAKNAANALLREPAIQKILAEGKPEAAFFAEDPDTGVPLKCRMDWVNPGIILDLKTFTQQRGRSINESVNAAIFYEKYYRQARFYVRLAEIVSGGHEYPCVMAFVESDEPHEVRIREFRPKRAGDPSLYWMRATLEIREMIRQYAEYWQRFGSDPWREDREIDPLADEELPQMAW